MPRCGALILAGGRSSRFGEEKALFRWSGRPLIDHVLSAVRAGLDPDLLMVGVRAPELHSDLLKHLSGLNLKIITDNDAIPGPLAGLSAGLQNAASRSVGWVFVCGCDMPEMAPQLLTGLRERALSARTLAAIVPGHRTHVEPLCAFYHAIRLPPHLDAFAASGGRSLTGLIRRLKENDLADVVDERGLAQLDPGWRRSLTNINHKDDLDRLS